jgi:aspartyl-tRNA(Asn)/glutamyl-tRNA(Gln) amidotransferase subunit B
MSTRSSIRAACARCATPGALERIVDAVIAANQKSVDEFRAGKEKAFNALVGQAMKASGGKADPAEIGRLLRKKLP